MAEKMLPHEVGDGPPPEDVVIGPLSELLNGRIVHYRYTSGREYTLTFKDGDVTFEMLDGPNFKKDEAGGLRVTLPCHVREIHPNEFLVHWLVPGREGHVALVIDIPNAKIFVSALMPQKWEFFDVATIMSVKDV